MFPLRLGLDVAVILSISVESILYGISLVMFGGTMWALTQGRSTRKDINWFLALVAVIMTVLSTIHLAVDIYRLIDGFITKIGSFPGGPACFFADVTQQTFIVKNSVYVLQTLLGDGALIYRCHLVWQSWPVILLPVLLWCAASAISAGFLYRISEGESAGNGFVLDFGMWIIPFSLLTMTINIVSSVLLAYRIWMTNQVAPGVVRVPSRSEIEVTHLLRILMDAVVLYTLAHFSLIVCFTYRNAGQFIVLDMITHIVSITFYAVLVRIALARNKSTRVPSPAISPLRTAARVVPSPSERALVGARRSSF